MTTAPAGRYVVDGTEFDLSLSWRDLQFGRTWTWSGRDLHGQPLMTDGTHDGPLLSLLPLDPIMPARVADCLREPSGERPRGGWVVSRFARLLTPRAAVLLTTVGLALITLGNRLQTRGTR